jgi:hypothetical protein
MFVDSVGHPYPQIYIPMNISSLIFIYIIHIALFDIFPQNYVPVIQ